MQICLAYTIGDREEYCIHTTRSCKIHRTPFPEKMLGCMWSKMLNITTIISISKPWPIPLLFKPLQTEQLRHTLFVVFEQNYLQNSQCHPLESTWSSSVCTSPCTRDDVTVATDWNKARLPQYKAAIIFTTRFCTYNTRFVSLQSNYLIYREGNSTNDSIAV